MKLEMYLLLLWAVVLSGCADLPRDPEGTSETVRQGTLRVGFLEAPSFVKSVDGRPEGPEVDMVREIARDFEIEPKFVPVSLDNAIRGLEAHQFQIVIGGFDKDTPVKKRVALTRPYDRKKEHVLLLPPGENGWLMRLDKKLYERTR